MHTLSTAGLAAIASSEVPLAILVSMAFATPVNLCSSNMDLVINGTTYLGLAGLGKISEVQTTAAEIRQLQFELSGPPDSMLSLALGGSVQGTPVTISVAILDPATYTVTDVISIWGGVLDTMKVVESATASTIQVSAEHLGIDLNRPSPLYYTDQDQQTLYPGDLFFQYTSRQFDQQIVWPNAAYFRK